MNRLQLLERLDRAWQAFKASYFGLSDSELLESRVTGNWSIRDIIAHVTWWEDEALKNLPLILAGEKPVKYSVVYGGIDAFNAHMTEQMRNLSLDEVLQQRDKTHQRLIEYIENVPEDQIAQETHFRHRLRLDTYSHYPKHTDAIWKWRKQQTAG